MLPILLTFWPFMETVLKRNKKILGDCPVEEEEKIQSNILTTLNAIGSIILIILYFQTTNNEIIMATILFPIVFYIYDTYYIWFQKNKNDYNYVLHHLTAIYLIQCIYSYDGNVRTANLIVFMCIELSNLPLYYVYHYLKTNKVKDCDYYKKLLNLKIFQLSSYGFLRVVVCGYLLYKYFNDIKHKPVFTSSMVLIYCMGAYWLQHQVKGYFKTKKEYKELLCQDGKINEVMVK